MICKRCGLNNPEGNFCANCGADLRGGDAYTDYSPAGTADFNAPVVNPVINLLNSAAKNNMFLSVCILLSVSAVFSILNGAMPGLFLILHIIFAWLIFAAACKENITFEKIRNVSGTIKAEYILNYVSAGMFVFLGILLTAILSIFDNEPGLWEQVLAEVEELISPEEYELFLTLLDEAGVLFLVLVFAAFFVVAVFGVLINVLIFRPMWRFARSLWLSVQQGRFMLEKSRKAATVIMVYGILCAISALGADDIMGTIEQSAQAAAMIVGSVWLKKYIVCCECQGGYDFEAQPNTNDIEE